MKAYAFLIFNITLEVLSVNKEQTYNNDKLKNQFEIPSKESNEEGRHTNKPKSTNPQGDGFRSFQSNSVDQPGPSTSKKTKLEQATTENGESFTVYSSTTRKENVSETKISFIKLYQHPQKNLQTYSSSDPRFFDSLAPQTTIDIPLHSNYVLDTTQRVQKRFSDCMEDTGTRYLESGSFEQRKRCHLGSDFILENWENILRNVYFHAHKNLKKGYFRSTTPARISHNGKVINFSLSKSCSGDSNTKEETEDSPDSQGYYYMFVRWNNHDSAMKLRDYLLKRKEQYLKTDLHFDDLIHYLKKSKEDKNLIVDEVKFDILVYRTEKNNGISCQAEKYIWDLLDKGETEISLPNSENWNYCSKSLKRTKKEVSDLINKFKYKFVASFKVTYTGAEVGRKLIFTGENESPKMDITCKTVAVDMQVDQFSRSQPEWKLKDFVMRFAGLNIHKHSNIMCKYTLYKKT